MSKRLLDCHTLITGTLWSLEGARFDLFKIKETSESAIAIDEKGIILEVGKSSALKKKYRYQNFHSFLDSILLPGFIDTHIHFPQMLQIGRFGESLLGWLDKYIYPEEIRLLKKGPVSRLAPLFFQELISNGTTSALILSNSSSETTDTLFKEALKLGFPATIGKVSMDRLAPKSLCVPAGRDKEESSELISKWHSRGRLQYALTPRFSPACSSTLLKNLGDLAEKFSEVRIQTHFAENLDELKLVRKLFPKSKDYLKTYEDFGLLNNRTVLAHGVYASSSEIQRISKLGVHIAHCPTANLFLGSGLFPFKKYQTGKASVAVGTDVGAGTDFSIWKTLASAYAVQQLQGNPLTPGQLFYLATQAGADALGCLETTGALTPGRFADFQVINWRKSARLKAQMENTKSAEERFFALLFQFERQFLEAVFLAGKNRLPSE